MNLCAFFDNKSLGNFNHFSAIVGLKPDIEFSKMKKVSHLQVLIMEVTVMFNQI